MRESETRSKAPKADTNLLKVDIVGELHVLRVDPENLETTSGIRNADIDLTIEPTKATESRVN